MTMYLTRTWVEDGKLIIETIPQEAIYKREWQGLTDEEWAEIVEIAPNIGDAIRMTQWKLKEKNT